MKLLPGMFALLVAAAGWHYLFYSRSARRLGGLEDPRTSHQRLRLRQLGGMCMLLLAALFLAGFWVGDRPHPGTAFVLIWLTVMLLLLMIVVLGLMDLRLTWRMHRRRMSERSGPDDPPPASRTPE